MKKKLAFLLALSLAGLFSTTSFADEIYVPGSYSGEAQGMGTVEVTVTVDETR